MNALALETPPPLRQLQFAFTAHLRDPAHQPAPSDIEERRMAIYRELIFNNIEQFLQNGFPVLRKIYSDCRWNALARDFIAHHRCQTPIFSEIPKEFVDYLMRERELSEEDPPFLVELAHYEWVELALATSRIENDLSGIDPNGDLIDAPPALSPLAWSFGYRFPVHRIGPDYQPESPPEQPSYLVVYRDRTLQVRFLEINPVTARMIELLRAGEEMEGADEATPTGRAIIDQISVELAHPHPEVVLAGGQQALEELHRHGIVLGSRL